MISRTLKYSLIVVAAAIVGYAALTVYGEVTKTETARLIDSVQLAENQAMSMNRSLEEVSSLASGNPTAKILGPSSQYQPVNQAMNIILGLGGVTTVFAAEDTGTEHSGTAPQPQIGEVGEVTDIDTLLAHWNPRYADAKLAYTQIHR